MEYNVYILILNLGKHIENTFSNIFQILKWFSERGKILILKAEVIMP